MSVRVDMGDLAPLSVALAEGAPRAQSAIRDAPKWVARD